MSTRPGTETQLDHVHPALVLALRACGRRVENLEEPERRFEYCMAALAEIDGTHGRWKPGREPITEHMPVASTAVLSPSGATTPSVANLCSISTITK